MYTLGDGDFHRALPQIQNGREYVPRTSSYSNYACSQVLRGDRVDRIASKRTGTSNRTEIYFAVFNHRHISSSFIKLAETL